MRLVRAAALACLLGCGGSANVGPASSGGAIRTLVVSVQGGGGVSSTPAGIACGRACSAKFVDGTVVTLAAHPDPGFTFAGRSGACSGVNDCVVALGADTTVTARFDVVSAPVRRALSIAVTGLGRVTSSPGSIDCGTSCNASFDDGAHVALHAEPAQGGRFAGWSGACSLSADCELALNSDLALSARFEELPPAQFSLNVVIAGQGRVSSPSGLDCASSCSHNFTVGTQLALGASAAPGWTFSGWSPPCTGADCTIVLTSDTTVTATFTQAPVVVHITPQNATVIADGSVQFTATVEGTADQRVYWMLALGGAGGTIDATGAYSAPKTPGIDRVIATSRADPSRTATATVVVTQRPSGVAITIKPGDLAAPSNSQWRYAAEVTGASDTTVTWSVLEGPAGGTIDQDGYYISPMTAGVYHVVATSNADHSTSASVAVRTNTPLVDEGGAVQPSATVYAVWWGSASVFGDSPTQLAQIFAALAGTPYLRTLDQYMRGAKANVSFAGSLFDPSSPPAAITPVDSEICTVLDAHGIAPRSDGFYALFVDNFPPGSSAWHSSGSCHGVEITYAYIPNGWAGTSSQTQPDVCGRSQTGGGFALDAIHELFETMTNPGGKTWIDPVNAFAPEIADKCASMPTMTCAVTLNDGSNWRLPYMWSNAVGHCVETMP